ncbi:efflux RND transporter permease subunit [Borrelia sp. BU AG58]|uniref:efflux RND transporter permease subunit n=1 Tax=Borrelia sp. BU AG58 TaxID=2887345 RepID=UPI001E4190DA|nr:efflux RND transporter permease subunit [Borrelia sp. BU AG58]UER67344.1 efflux RND transporter permease subunit [Borrelia sp. BU AG58]
MLVKKVVDKPITMLVLFLLIAMVSVYAFTRLKIDLLPAIENSVITIYTAYPGASPKEVEERVSSVFESSLASVKNVEKIDSSSFKGASSVVVKFHHGSNLDLALNEIRDVIDSLKDLLPKETSTPKIMRFRSGDIPVMTFVIYSDRSVSELRRYAVSIVKPRLEGLNGVGLVEVLGGSDRSILIEISQNKLESYGITLSEIAASISSQNFELSAGNVIDNGLEYLTQVPAKFASIRDLENVVVSYRNPDNYSLGSPPPIQIKLKDIAKVKSTFKELDYYGYYNGKPSIVLELQKHGDASPITVSNAVNEEIDKIRLALPRDISLDLVSDTSEFIKESISSVADSAYYGAILAVCIIFFFLRSFRATIIIGISIPLAVVITFCLMYFVNVSLNLLSLSGLALGVGMLVDCSISVIDNIYKYRQKGTKLIPSAILGAQEMMLPIVSSTLTSICVFAPVLVFRSELGVIADVVRDFAFTIVIALLASLFVAIFLVPVLAVHYVGLYTTFQKPIKNKFIKRVDDFFYGIYYFGEVFYVKLLKYVLSHKVSFSFIIIFSFLLSLFSFLFLNVSSGPSVRSSSIRFTFQFPDKINLESSKFYAGRLLEIIKDEIKDYKSIITQVYSSEVGFQVELPPGGDVDEKVMDPEILKYRVYGRVAQLYPYLNTKASSEGGFFGGSPIDIKIIASNFEAAKDYGSLLVNALKREFPNLVNLGLNVKEEENQIDIDIDRDKVYSYGISMSALSREIKANIDGISAGKYTEDGLNYDILLRLDRSDITNLKDLNKIFIKNTLGVKIPLSSVARLKKTKGVGVLFREDQSSVVRLKAGIPPGENLASITSKVTDFITNKFPQRDGILVDFKGEYDVFIKSMEQFRTVVFMAVLLVFGIMASQFESLLKPFIIFFTIPLTVVGIALIHLITRETVSVFTGIGMLMLVGVVVNTGIVLIDYINLLVKRGFVLREAVLEGGRSRFRPVLMSALTSIMGLIPLAFSNTSGGALVKPIAITFIGGMTASTFLTLLFIPMIFEIFSKISVKNFSFSKSLKLINKSDSHKKLESVDCDKNNRARDSLNDFFIEEDDD